MIPGDIGWDGGEGANCRSVHDDATATVARVAPPEVSLSLYGGEDCIEEDSTGNQVDVTVDPVGDDLLTEIVVTGLQVGWTYAFTGLGGAGINVDTSEAGQVTITFDTPTNATTTGSFLPTPPTDPAVDPPHIHVIAYMEAPHSPPPVAHRNP